MEVREEFLDFIAGVKHAVLHTYDLPKSFEVENSEQVLSAIASIAASVLTEMEYVRQTRGDLTVGEADAVLDLEKVLRRLRGEEKINLAALQKFNAMTSGSVLVG